MAGFMPHEQCMTPQIQPMPSQEPPDFSRCPNQRSSPRRLIVCPISISSDSGTAHGILRDISEGGIFFYSSFRPSLGMNIQFSLQLKDKHINGRGEVVRVEQSAPGAAIGIAIKFCN